jgi:hypothetical protein
MESNVKGWENFSEMFIRRDFSFKFYYKIPSLCRAEQMQLILICCSPPRKSLVKGERFIRFEEEQEFVKVDQQKLIAIYIA